MTSAVKVGGERLYRKAHRGEEVETPIRPVTIYRAELIESDRDRATFEIECSSGTYIRTLIETLEDAYCESLRRLSIDDLHVPEQSPREIAAEELVSFLPERLLDDEEATAVSHGRPVLEPFDVPPEHVDSPTAASRHGRPRRWKVCSQRSFGTEVAAMRFVDFLGWLRASNRASQLRSGCTVPDW
jgi:tRNA U55 pseudouridine synthase TruB